MIDLAELQAWWYVLESAGPDDTVPTDVETAEWLDVLAQAVLNTETQEAATHPDPNTWNVQVSGPGKYRVVEVTE